MLTLPFFFLLVKQLLMSKAFYRKCGVGNKNFKKKKKSQYVYILFFFISSCIGQPVQNVSKNAWWLGRIQRWFNTHAHTQTHTRFHKQSKIHQSNYCVLPWTVVIGFKVTQGIKCIFHIKFYTDMHQWPEDQGHISSFSFFLFNFILPHLKLSKDVCKNKARQMHDRS